MVRRTQTIEFLDGEIEELSVVSHYRCADDFVIEMAKAKSIPSFDGINRGRSLRSLEDGECSDYGFIECSEKSCINPASLVCSQINKGCGARVCKMHTKEIFEK